MSLYEPFFKNNVFSGLIRYSYITMRVDVVSLLFVLKIQNILFIVFFTKYSINTHHICNPYTWHNTCLFYQCKLFPLPLPGLPYSIHLMFVIRLSSTPLVVIQSALQLLRRTLLWSYAFNSCAPFIYSFIWIDMSLLWVLVGHMVIVCHN